MKKIYQITEHVEEVSHRRMNWDKFNEDPTNYLYSISDQNFVDVTKEFDNEADAEKFICEHPFNVIMYPDYVFIQWYEMGCVTIDEDGDEINYESIDASRLTRDVDKLNSIRDEAVAGLDTTEFRYVVLANEYFAEDSDWNDFTLYSSDFVKACDMLAEEYRRSTVYDDTFKIALVDVAENKCVGMIDFGDISDYI
nr:MAG TPA: hypothetical protein [Caudoviricetes sp.]DAY40690.1 MAG TPA: hypothetical protein [Caudoviricetes sp.]